MNYQVNICQKPFLQFGFPKIFSVVNPIPIDDVQQKFPLANRKKQAWEPRIESSFDSDFRQFSHTYIRFVFAMCNKNLMLIHVLNSIRLLEDQVEKIGNVEFPFDLIVFSESV
jgi:hypothetical protein